MGSSRPKVMLELAGEPMILRLLRTLQCIGLSEEVVVVGPGMEELEQIVHPRKVVIQTERLGTGHAVQCALPVLQNQKGVSIVVFGDSPLIGESILNELFTLIEADDRVAVAVAAFEEFGEHAYGRLVTTSNGQLVRIVEHKDCSEAERAIHLCNSGVLAVRTSLLPDLVNSLRNENVSGEFYLTDIIGLAIKMGFRCAYVTGNARELCGVNTKAELAILNRQLLESQ